MGLTDESIDAGHMVFFLFRGMLHICVCVHVVFMCSCCLCVLVFILPVCNHVAYVCLCSCCMCVCVHVVCASVAPSIVLCWRSKHLILHVRGGEILASPTLSLHLLF